MNKNVMLAILIVAICLVSGCVGYVAGVVHTRVKHDLGIGFTEWMN